MSDIQPVPEGTQESGVEKVQEPVRIPSKASTNADEVATVQAVGLAQEEFRREVADGA
jgi:hypothetical protein